MSDGRAFELPTSVPRITASDCSSLRRLPTPTASDHKRDNNPNRDRRKSPELTSVDVHFPTPRASEASQSLTAPGAARHVEKGMGGLTETIGVVLPTLRAQAREHPYAREDYHSNLEEWVGHWMEGSLDSTFLNSGAPTPPLFDVGSD